MRSLGQFQAFLFIFFTKRFHTQKKAQKSRKTHISGQKQKRQLFYALKKYLRRRKSLIRLFAYICFLCAQKRQYFYAHKTSKKKKIACLTFYAFYDFCAFYAFCLCMRIKKIWVKVACLRFCAFCAFYANKKHLSKSRLLRFVLFMLLFVCKIFSWKKIKWPWYPHLYYYSITTWFNLIVPFTRGKQLIFLFYRVLSCCQKRSEQKALACLIMQGQLH